jgi:hypothetical protein
VLVKLGLLGVGRPEQDGVVATEPVMVESLAPAGAS